MKKTRILVTWVGALLGLYSSAIAQAPKQGNIKPSVDTLAVREAAYFPAVIVTEPTQSNDIAISPVIDYDTTKYIYFKDTLYRAAFSIPANILLERYQPKVIPNKKYKEATSIEYDIEGKDTLRSYGDITDDKLEYENDMRYKFHYFVYPLANNEKDSAYLSCKYYYDGIKLTHKDHFNLDGSYSARQEYKYDQQGNLVYENYISLDKEGRVLLKHQSSSQSLYKYSENQIIKEEYEYRDEVKKFVLVKIETINLDKNKRPVRKIITDQLTGNTNYDIKYQYPRTNTEQVIWNSYGTISETTYEYNEYGEFTSIIRKDEREISTLKVQYSYDKYKNWITAYYKQTYQDIAGKPTGASETLVKRTLKY